MKNIYVKFTDSGARILVNPNNESELRADPNVLFNPDLSHVKGVPPENWKVVNNQIVPFLSYKIKTNLYTNNTKKLKKIIYLTNTFWLLLTITLCYVLNK